MSRDVSCMQAKHKRSTLQSLAMAFYPIVSLPFSMLYPVRHDCFSFFFQSFLHQLLTSPCSSKSMSFGTTDGDRGGPELLNARAAGSRPVLRPVQDVAGRARRAKVHTPPTGRARRNPPHHPKYTPRATSGLSLPSRGLPALAPRGQCDTLAGPLATTLLPWTNFLQGGQS